MSTTTKNPKVFKVLFSTYTMPKKASNKTKIGQRVIKAETSVIKSTITVEQREIIQKFIGVLGSNEQDVVSKIITLWLYNEGYLTGKKPRLKK